MAVSGEFELYDLESDRGETTEVSEPNPEVVDQIQRIMREARTESELFPLVRS